MTAIVRAGTISKRDATGANITSLSFTPSTDLSTQDWAAGDVAFVAVSYTNNSAFTLPSGWAWWTGSPKVNSTALTTGVAYKVLVTGDLTTATTWTIATGTQLVLNAMAVGGLDTTTLIDTAHQEQNGSASTSLVTGTTPATTYAQTFNIVLYAARMNSTSGVQSITIDGSHTQAVQTQSNGAGTTNHLTISLGYLTSNSQAAGATLGPYTATSSATATQYSTLLVTAKQSFNNPPTANAGPDQLLVTPGATITLDGTGSSDTDGTIASYAWTQTAGPTVTLTGSTTSHPTFTAPAVVGGTSVTFSLTVTDNSGAASTSSDSVTVTVALAMQKKVRVSGAWVAKRKKVRSGGAWI